MAEALVLPLELEPQAPVEPPVEPPVESRHPAPLGLAAAAPLLGAASARAVAGGRAAPPGAGASLAADEPRSADAPPRADPRPDTGPRVGFAFLPIVAGVLLLGVALGLGFQVLRQQGEQGVLGTTGRPGSGPGLVGASSSLAPTAVETRMPALNRSALNQAILLNARLAEASADLRAALAASPFDAVDVARVLRRISADAVYGSELASIVGGWGPAAQVGSNLSALYGSIHELAANALVPSVRLESAYREAAKTMIALLAAAKPVDDQARAFVLANGDVLPDASPASSALASPGPSAAP